MQTRLTTFDICKSIGILLVVFGHVLRGLDNAAIEVPYFDYVDPIVYSFHMPLFFVISGYFMAKSVAKRSASTLITSKLHTLMYPYLIWMLIQGFIEFAMSNYTNGNVELWRVFVVWLPRAHFWFLYVLMLFSVVYIVAANAHPRNPIILFFVAILLYCFPVEFESQIYYLYLYIKDNLVFFLFGALFPALITKTTHCHSRSAILLSLVVVTLLQTTRLYWMHSESWFMPFVHYSTAVSSIALVLQVAGFLSQTKQTFWTQLGELSMPIYLAHIVFASGLRIVLIKLGIDQPWLHIVVGTVVGIAGPIILYKLSNSLRFNSLFNSPFLKTAS
jgi:fucose 4-O-acetylase-like acetyltransferase